MLTASGPTEIAPALIEEAARHMRLATGAGGDVPADQASDIAEAIRASISHLETQLGLCLLPRGFVWTGRLRRDLSVAVPMVPVRMLTSAEVVRDAGGVESIEVDRFRIEPGIVRTRIFARFSIQGILSIAFDAGFGAEWQDTPDDLRRAVLMLAAHYYDARHAVGTAGAGMPFGVSALIQPWRPMRLSAGAA